LFFLPDIFPLSFLFLPSFLFSISSLFPQAPKLPRLAKDPDYGSIQLVINWTVPADFGNSDSIKHAVLRWERTKNQHQDRSDVWGEGGTNLSAKGKGMSFIFLSFPFLSFPFLSFPFLSLLSSFSICDVVLVVTFDLT